MADSTSRFRKFNVGTVSFLFLMCLYSAAGAERSTLVIGRVSDNPTKHYGELRPLLDYVVSHMRDLGITNGEVRLAKNKEGMIELLRAGRVDWATKGVFQAMLYSELGGAEIFLRSWRGGTPTYQTVMFSRRDNGLRSLLELKGKKIAFEDPGSTSAYFIPVAILRRAGLAMLHLRSPRESVPADKVGYAFAGGELNISVWVHEGLTHAGAYHNQDWDNPSTNPPAIRKHLRIFHWSRPLPRMVEIVRGDLEPRIKNRLKEVLLKAHEDPKAQDALKAYSRTTRFDEFIGEAREGLEEARGMLRLIPEAVNGS